MVDVSFSNISLSSKMVIFAIFTALIFSCCADNVPVLMWSPSRPLSDLPLPFVGNTVDDKTFHQSYLSPLASTTDNHIVVFLQDKLNINDFAKYADIYNPYSDGGAFKNIKDLMDENFSVHLPSVKTPVSAINQLKENFKGREHIVKSPSDIANLKLDDKSYLILVVLPDTNGAVNEENVFEQNDNVVSDVVKELKKRSIKYTGLYTAESSQQKLSEFIHTGRRLLDSDDTVQRNDSIFINVTEDNISMYFYSRKIQLFIIDPVSLTNFNLTMPINDDLRLTNDSTITNITATFAVEFPGVSPVNSTDKYDFSFRFELNRTIEQRMVFTKFTLSLKNGSTMVYDGEMMDMTNLELNLPAMFSYHCSAFNIIQRNRSKTEPYVKLSIDGFQFQAFTIQNDMFGHSWDCVPFFTTAIWMALFYGVIFIFILYYGMSMMANLSTMDRFDDPKGKTITVNVSE